MKGHRFSNTTIIIISACLAVLSLIYGIVNFDKAFPEISLNLEVSKEQAAEIAHDFLKGRRFDLTDYRHTSILSSDTWAKYYLERESGVEETARINKEDVDIWYWNVRYYKPLEQTEYVVKINPAGEVTGFRRTLPEMKEGLKVSAKAARIFAETFLRNNLFLDLDNWEYLESNAVEKPQRRDHVFTWQKRNYKAIDAPLKLSLSTQGAEIGGFSFYLDIPQSWQQQFTRQRSQNKLFQNIADFLSAFLIVFGFVYFFKHSRNHQIPWKIALIAGALLFASKIAMGLNSIPLALTQYDTTVAYSAYLGKYLLGITVESLLEAMLVILLVGAAEYLYRNDFPGKLAIQNIFTRRGFKSREVFQATIMGYVLAAFDIGFVVFYYIIGKNFGFWSPVDVEYDNALSTALPWIYPLAVSIGAAILEEFWFRAFGISFFSRLFKSKVFGIIIPALIWGFLHSSYPQQPGFVRGIEVGIIGILAGLVMMRFGIWAVLVWHFVIDAVWVGLFLFQSQQISFQIYAAVICTILAIPAIITAISFLVNRKFAPVDALVNKNVQQPPPLAISYDYDAKPVKLHGFPNYEAKPISWSLSKASKSILIMLAVSGTLFALLPQNNWINKQFSPDVTRAEALKMTCDTLSERYGIDCDDYKLVALDDQTIFQDKSRARNFFAKLSYLKKFSDPQVAEGLIFDSTGVGFMNWNVQAKRPNDPSTFTVLIDQMTGQTTIFRTLPDSAKGADLDQDTAKEIAQKAFKRIESDHEAYDIVSERIQQQESRSDHFYAFETKEPVTAEAHFKRGVSIKGKEVLTGNRYLKIPESWYRHEIQRDGRWIVVQALGFLVIILGAVIGLLSLTKKLKKHEIGWKPGVLAGVVVMVFAAIGEINNLTTFWWGYNPVEPAKGFILEKLLYALMAVFFKGFNVAVVLSLIDALVKGSYGYSIWSFSSSTTKTNKSDFLILVFGIFGVFAGITYLSDFVISTFNLPKHNFIDSFPVPLGSFFPWLNTFISDLYSVISVSSLVLFSFLLLVLGFDNKLVRWLILMTIGFVIAGYNLYQTGNPTNAELIVQMARMCLIIAITYLILIYWIRGRFLILFSALFLSSLFKHIIEFFTWQGSDYCYQGWFLVILSAVSMYFIWRYLLFSEE